ncbi:MAG: hypothetical protein WCW30_02000, partial [Candidatus Gracilibacteria bacterium]
LTHKTESVFDQIRSGKISVNRTLIDALLISLDTLSILVKEVETKIQSGINISDVLKNLDQFLIQDEKAKPICLNNSLGSMGIGRVSDRSVSSKKNGNSFDIIFKFSS